MTPSRPTRLAVVGGGWRSEFFLRIAQQLPEHIEVTGVHARSVEHREQLAARFGVRPLDSLDDVVASRPDVALVAVPWPAAPGITTALVGRGVRVLEETPPAPDLDGMRRLWAEVGASGLVQVADQSMFMPSHAARLTMLREGAIGTPTSAHVSSNHLYHAVSIMRGLLGAGKGPTTVVAHDLTGPLVDPLSRDGWTGSAEPVDRVTTLASLDFGGGRSGLYDFTDNQWFNPLRRPRLLVRGSHGEITGDEVVSLKDGTVISSTVVRRQTGLEMNLEGFALDTISFEGRAVYRNPFPGVRLSDEDLSIATLVRDTGLWARDEGPAPYPLADGLQDHLVGLAIVESAATGRPVTTSAEAWADAPSPFEV